MLYMLYNIIVLISSIMFLVAITVTMSCDLHNSNCDVILNPNPSSKNKK